MTDVTLFMPNTSNKPIAATYENGRMMETDQNRRLHMMNLSIDLKENNLCIDELMTICSRCLGDIGLMIKRENYYFNHDVLVVMNEPTISISISPDDRNKIGLYISSDMTYGPNINSGSITIGNKKFPSLLVSRNIYMVCNGSNELNIVIPASEVNVNEITDLFSENDEVVCEGVFYTNEKIKINRVLEIKYIHAYEISEFNKSDVFPIDTISITILAN